MPVHHGGDLSELSLSKVGSTCSLQACSHSLTHSLTLTRTQTDEFGLREPGRLMLTEAQSSRCGGALTAGFSASFAHVSDDRTAADI